MKLSPAEIAEAVEAGRAFAVHACGTCRHHRKDSLGVSMQKCTALGCFCSTARLHECGPEGKFWEPMPPRQRGVIELAWRWLFGGKG